MSEATITERQEYWQDQIRAADAFEGSLVDRKTTPPSLHFHTFWLYLQPNLRAFNQDYIGGRCPAQNILCFGVCGRHVPLPSLLHAFKFHHYHPLGFSVSLQYLYHTTMNYCLRLEGCQGLVSKFEIVIRRRRISDFYIKDYIRCHNPFPPSVAGLSSMRGFGSEDTRTQV